MNKRSFNGIIPALYTCFEDSGSVNYKETARLAKWLVKKGCGGFYLCGTTGSGLLLSKEEREKILESVAESVNGDVPIMVHVGSMATKDAVELAKHAAGIKGVCGISSLPPQYYPVGFDDEIANLSIIAEATDIPFYPYLFESTVNKYGVDNLINGFAKIPNMAGIKAFVADLSIHQAIVNNGPAHWQLFHGFDQCLLQALSIPQITAVIGSTYNVVPEIVIEIFNAIKNNDYKKGSALSCEFRKYWLSIQGYSFLGFGSYFLKKRGFRMGQPRLPLRWPDNDEIIVVENRMQKSGFNLENGGIM
ncbi:MAG: dihydrodipicolinate synthase family protein [Planctomycetaceae bacterium]|nr:dihydrodipicolinate synthase family protein [Planctomycetaceae bacterium]